MVREKDRRLKITMSKEPDNTIEAAYVSTDPAIDAIDDSRWAAAHEIGINKYWSGAPAPVGRHSSARMIWSSTAMCVRFDSVLSEPLVVSETPVLSSKTLGLWDRDVVEIFVAPDPDVPLRYYEFEAAPTGEWVDLTIEHTAAGRTADQQFESGMTTFSAILPSSIITTVRIPWAAFGKSPVPGEKWMGNLFRCVGSGPGRGYLCWRPTMTESPNFHVPERFGEIVFTG